MDPTRRRHKALDAAGVEEPLKPDPRAGGDWRSVLPSTSPPGNYLQLGKGYWLWLPGGGTLSGGQVILCGDVNGDSVVNVFDAITLLQMAVGLIQPTAAQIVAGDLNRDGAIDVLDATMALQISVGMISVAVCGPPGT